ncbi:MAG: triose-phosphate isomerase [Candidatus Aminicenantes bacterium]|nr:MAG: triose-phosphate isomerase [Candidatus Aminicenantes bacterium]
MNFTNKNPFIAGNWKMFKTIPEAVDMVQKLHEASVGMDGAQFVVIPPFTALSEVARALQESPIQIGAQNMHWEEQGAFTGEVAAPMLKDVGCTFVVLGHSERRQFFGETSETVNKKIKAAFAHGLVPIMCIGESLEERKNGNTITKVQTQITEGLEELDAEKICQIIFAYEPIWAIGTGLTATPDQAQEVHGFIRSSLAEKHGNTVASCAIILYGGSVKPENTYSLLKEKDINGALVGGASLKADSFAEIAREAIKAYEEK